MTSQTTIDTIEGEREIGRKLAKAKQALENVQCSKGISENIKQALSEKLDTLLLEVGDSIMICGLPAEFRDSIQLIERTLAEPELYSLPTLVMWKETAKEKIEKIQIFIEYWIILYTDTSFWLSSCKRRY